MHHLSWRYDCVWMGVSQHLTGKGKGSFHHHIINSSSSSLPVCSPVPFPFWLLRKEFSVLFACTGLSPESGDCACGGHTPWPQGAGEGWLFARVGWVDGAGTWGLVQQCVCWARRRKNRSGVGVSLVLIVKMIIGPTSWRYWGRGRVVNACATAFIGQSGL